MRPASQGGKERGMEKRGEKEEGEGEHGERGQLACLCHLQNHHPKTRIHLIGIVGKIYNELVSHRSHAELFPITIAHEINCTVAPSSA